MRKVRNLLVVVFCLALIGAMIAGCGGSSKPSGGDPTPTPGGSTTSWIETFDGVPDGTSIIPADQDSRVLSLDNKDSFLFVNNPAGDIWAGTSEGGTGTIALDNRTAATATDASQSRRMAFVAPGLKSATNPKLKLTIKNLGSQSIVIKVGNAVSTSDSTGQNAYGPISVPNTSYQVIEVSLGSPTTEVIQLRPLVGTSGTGAQGIYIDKIEVTGLPDTGGIPAPITSTDPTPAPTTSSDPSPSPSSTPEPLYAFTRFSDSFNVVDNNLFTIAYKTLTSDSSKSMYYSTGGSSNTTIVDVSTVPVDKAIKIGSGARFTIGQTVQEKDTTAVGVYPNGEFDLSKPYKISFKVVDVLGDGTKKFQVYVDNNSTSAGNSYHEGSTTSRIYSENLASHTVGNTVEILSSVGTTRSFIQLRVETTNGYITIDDLVIEYQ